MGFWVPLMKPVYNGMYCWLLGGLGKEEGFRGFGRCRVFGAGYDKPGQAPTIRAWMP